MIHYDIVYMSKVFSAAYSPGAPEPMNADFVPTRLPTLDATCPFRDNANRRCVIYDARPDICRVYRCDKAARGEFSGDMSGEFDDYGLVNVCETFFREATRHD